MSYDVVHLTPETARQIKKWLAQLEAARPVAREKGNVEPAAVPTLVINNSGETIPPYGCMAVVNYRVLEHESGSYFAVVVVDKPSTTFRRHYLVNGPEPILAEGQTIGKAQSGRLVRVLYDTADGTPAYGQGYGPAANSWKVKENYPETALVVGPTDDDATLVAEWHSIDRLLVKSAGAITQGNPGNFTIYRGPTGSEASLSMTIEGFTIFGDIDNNVWCWLTNQSGDNWYATMAECGSP